MPAQEHREKDHTHDYAQLMSMVAKSITVREAMTIPAAKAALAAEWKKLWDMGCWEVDSVCG